MQSKNDKLEVKIQGRDAALDEASEDYQSESSKFLWFG